MNMARSFYDRMVAKFVDWLTKDPPPAEPPPCDFNRLKYELRPGDVILIEGRSRISKVIRLITQSPWTHAALYIGKLHDIDDHRLRKSVITHMKKRENVRLLIEGLPGVGTIKFIPTSSYPYLSTHWFNANGCRIGNGLRHQSPWKTL
jgi:hypothetical protein